MSSPINASKPPAAPAPKKPPAPPPKPADTKQAQTKPPAQQARQKDAPKTDTPRAQQPKDAVTRSAEANDTQPDGAVSHERQAQFSGFADNFGGPADDKKMGGTVGRDRNSSAFSGIWGGPDGSFDCSNPGQTTEQPSRSETARTATTTVTVEPWGSGKNDSVWTSLTNAGYTDQQIVDQNLVDQVAQQNKLEDPNVVNPGQQLVIPNTPGGPNPTPPADPNTPGQPPQPADPAKPMNAQELDKNSDPQALKERDYASTFNQNFADFDAAADKDHKTDGTVSQKDIEAIANGTVYADEKTRAAARYYQDNPDALRQLDQAGASDQDKGKGDNKIAQTDAEANLNAANQRVRDTGRTEAERQAYDANKNRVNDNALQTIEQNFDKLAGPDGTFKKDELNKLAKDSSADPAMREAAQFLIDNPDRMNRADGAAAGDKSADGTFALADIKGARIDTFNDLRKNPDAQRTGEVQQQQTRQWDSPQAALQNLKQNPDLSTYSDEQLLALNLLAQKDPQARDLLAATTGNYVNARTNSVDDIPTNQGFQLTLGTQVVSPQNLDQLSPETRKIVESARGHLQTQVNTNLTDSFSHNLDGKSGDQGVDQAIDGFKNDVEKLAKENPALGPLIESGAQELGKNEDLNNKINDVQQADDNAWAKAADWVGDKVAGVSDWAGDKLGDVVEVVAKNNPMARAFRGAADQLGMDWVGNYQDNLAQGLDRFVESTIGGIGGTIGGIMENPTDTLKGAWNLAKPTVSLMQGDLQGFVEGAGVYKDLGEAFISDYKETWQKDGVVAGLSHIGADALTTFLTGGTSKAAEGVGIAADAARAAGRLDNLGDAGRAVSGAYGHLTGGLGNVAEDLLTSTRLPDWAQSMASGAIGDVQGAAVQNAPQGQFNNQGQQVAPPQDPVAGFIDTASQKLNDFFKILIG